MHLCCWVYVYICICICSVRLAEAVRLREFDPKEDGKLSEFQEELVEMAAVLCGDHHNNKGIFPHKLTEGMSVVSAAEYVQNAFNKFLQEYEKLKENGADENTIISIPSQPTPTNKKNKQKPSTSPSFASKFFSCLVCGNHS